MALLTHQLKTSELRIKSGTDSERSEQSRTCIKRTNKMDERNNHDDKSAGKSADGYRANVTENSEESKEPILTELQSRPFMDAQVKVSGKGECTSSSTYTRSHYQSAYAEADPESTSSKDTTPDKDPLRYFKFGYLGAIPRGPRHQPAGFSDSQGKLLCWE